ncbi:MAG: menaquinone biosynthesis decarboxylase [Halanaerobiales bacterium]
MGYIGLREFITTLEENDELIRVQTEVDSELEITEITDRVVKANGPALIFENIKGSDFPVLINAFGSYRRMELALQVNSLAEIADRINAFLEIATPENIIDKLRVIPLIKEISRFFPHTVKKAPCQEIIRDGVNLNIFPILKCWPGDGGKFITLPLVFTRDLDSNKQNVGMYRMQVYDKETTGMHWHIHKDGAYNYRKYLNAGKRMEVAVAIGADPASIYAATAPLPAGLDEMVFAGFLRRAPVPMVQCKTIDLKVPADAEIILEGYLEPGELREEGPFGDHTGYYSTSDDYPVFHIQKVTHRDNPIYNTTIVGKPPMEDCFLAKATERIFLPLLKLQLPEILDLNLPLEGVFHNCAILSIEKSYPGQAKKVMHAIWGMGQMMFTKMIVVVDGNVDVHDLSTVAWKVFNNIDARRDVVIVDGPLDVLDHSSPLPSLGSKIGIDATRTWPEEGHFREWPAEIEMVSVIKELVDRRWSEYGINY